ncbi:MAG: hypothetical protein KGY54_02955 [Oleiphilaceae bacterium]|nr:hypothetical protein [Oleiphilaceae bacterium]
MERKTDNIRAILVVFVIGLAISGFTTIQSAEDSATSAAAVAELQANTRASD